MQRPPNPKPSTPSNTPQEKAERPVVKTSLHPRNKFRERYDFEKLVAASPALEPFVITTPYGDASIDFFDPEAVKALNAALLKSAYGITFWDIPEGYLCPPIPGRADYIHLIGDLLGTDYKTGKAPTGKKIRCLDIGVGANCIYPIIGNQEYGWQFVGSDIDPVAVASANEIVSKNAFLKGRIECRLQPNPKDFFQGIVQKGEFFDVSICNPPFHASAEEARAEAFRKHSNLRQAKTGKPVLNFGGQGHELWCEGGEEKFVKDMIVQSKQFSSHCFWFSALIAKESNIKGIHAALKKAGVVEEETLPMGQGNKQSRVVAWTFLTKEQQRKWVALRDK